MKLKLIFFLAISGLLFSSCKPKYDYSFRDPSLSFEERADNLVSLMTLDEKISQLNYQSAAIDRLGVPAYNWWNECLHGVARAGEATVFPQAIGMAATWDRDMMAKISNVISDEARAKHAEFVSRDKRGIYQGLTFWSPNINIFRDPRWGRGMETYGEDPYLTGEMAVQFIKGLQGNDPKYLKVVATSKHYAVHSGPEPLRHSFNAEVSVRDLRDTYLPAFRKTVTDANVYSVMCAYNRFEGKPCCGSSELENSILRDEFGFDGYVVSDCGAISDFYKEGGHNVAGTREEAAAMAFINGTDLNCGKTSQYLKGAFEQGLITEQEIDISVKRLVLARLKLGMFDPQEDVPFANIPYSVVCSENNHNAAVEAAKKSIVLLKNDGNALPLSKNLKRIAVIGPNADDIETLLGNYNGTPRHPLTPLQGIVNKAGNNTHVIYAPGCRLAENIPLFDLVKSNYLFTDKDLSTHGLNARFYDNQEFEGDPVISRIDSSVDYFWWDRDKYEGLVNDDFSAEWTGYIVPPVSGKYAIGCEAKTCELFLDGESLATMKNIHEYKKKYSFVELEAGKPYEIKLKTYDFHGDAKCTLLWDIPGRNLEAQAVKAANEADQVIMFMGLSPRLEGEEMKVEVEGFSGGDRMMLGLPDIQENLIRTIAATGKPVVLVLLNGSALAINWENENLPAIVESWYPGEAAGPAIADVLFGDYNPAGRLPVTFYKSVDDIPPFKDYDMKGRTYRYFEKEPLFPFGYGLSYTTFSYAMPKAEKSTYSAGEPVKVSVNVTNTGNVDGEEVVQLYVSYRDSKITRPKEDLRGFKRVMIKAGETKNISFELQSSDLEYYNEDSGSYEVEKCSYVLNVGPSSNPDDLKGVEIKID
ncbi:MAG TPA: glycoside hydrolase family 3 C-terminal domain-containing protein [Bacteroidales bacterium]|nr:glycoside hydrolase family 3 C-terminal domain-containing protein [Bacteroidales bacterium]